MDGLKRYVNDDRFRVDGDKKYAFTSVCVYNRLRVDGAWDNTSFYTFRITETRPFKNADRENANK